MPGANYFVSNDLLVLDVDVTNGVIYHDNERCYIFEYAPSYNDTAITGVINTGEGAFTVRTFNPITGSIDTFEILADVFG